MGIRFDELALYIERLGISNSLYSGRRKGAAGEICVSRRFQCIAHWSPTNATIHKCMLARNELQCNTIWAWLTRQALSESSDSRSSRHKHWLQCVASWAIRCFGRMLSTKIDRKCHTATNRGGCHEDNVQWWQAVERIFSNNASNVYAKRMEFHQIAFEWTRPDDSIHASLVLERELR